MNANAVDLKKTVNLPKTDFAMKANLPTAEPKTLAKWEEIGLYAQIREARKGRPLYILHDGPPYANGNIHLGTAFNKILKDFILKSKSMAGFDAPYVPGWDCHGLPIEFKVDQELGKRKATMTHCADPRGVPGIRGEVRGYPPYGVQAPGHLRALGRPLPDNERRLRGGHRAGIRGLSARWLCL